MIKKTSSSIYKLLKIIFLHDLFEFHDFGLSYLPVELSIKFLIDDTTYKNFMTNKFRFWAPKASDWTFDPIKYIFLSST
jgi:hypothetical protein